LASAGLSTMKRRTRLNPGERRQPRRPAERIGHKLPPREARYIDQIDDAKTLVQSSLFRLAARAPDNTDIVVRIGGRIQRVDRGVGGPLHHKRQQRSRGQNPSNLATRLLSVVDATQLSCSKSLFLVALVVTCEWEPASPLLKVAGWRDNSKQ
jgi:hypothetical protein